MQSDDNSKDQLERVLFFCQMLNYGFGSAGLWTVNNSVAHGYNTFADIHLVYTMFLVDKGDKPIGGFIYPILLQLKKENLLDQVRRILGEQLRNTTFEDYLRKYRNKLATHGDLSPKQLTENVREIVLGEEPDALLLELLDELREAVENLTTEIYNDLNNLHARS